MSTVLKEGERSIEVSKPDKTLFPDEGITKEDLARYYQEVGEVMLPHVSDRALTMHRFPDGIGEEGFIQKQAPDHFPAWVERRSLPKEGGDVDYVVANDVATLIYLADQGSITPHVTLSRVDRPDHPDRMIFDMDPPDESGDVGMVREAARIIKDSLDDLGLDSLLMTTGSRGFHILVPLDRSAPFDEVRSFAHDLGRLAANRHPDLLTVAQRKSSRGGRILVDYLRNAYGQTSVAPYGVRALPTAPVATPLEWDELSATSPRDYTIRNIRRRLGQKGDPWAGLDTRRGQSLSKQSARIERMLDSNAGDGR